MLPAELLLILTMLLLLLENPVEAGFVDALDESWDVEEDDELREVEKADEELKEVEEVEALETLETLWTEMGMFVEDDLE